jgi:hypothetical protein
LDCGQTKLDAVTGVDSSRQARANEFAGARYQGKGIAETAIELHGCWGRAAVPWDYRSDPQAAAGRRNG